LKPNKPSNPAPQDVERKKTVAEQAALCAQNGFSGYCGGFEYHQGRRSLCPRQRSDDYTLTRRL
ncbi:MAG: hypothetical protein ACLS76_17925, partial [Eubacterium callanderi]